MTIALASDHAGFDLKDRIAGFLASRGLGVVDFGTRAGEVADYVDLGAAAAAAIVSGQCRRGILVCGTGIGMAMVANKFKGIRAAVCWNAFTAEMSRRHNDANVLALGGRVLSIEEGLALVRIWLDTPFEGGRHARRVDKIGALENRNCSPSS
jgi:ribose 5-phosphate isomerase B